MAARATSTSTSMLETPGGQRIAVYRTGDPARPAVVLVHGFPDDHSAWDGIVDRLAEDHHVVTYDTRGVGGSSRPKRIADYRLDQLADDLQTVIDSVNTGNGVHLVGHDWGSVQAWHLITGDHHGVVSFTSISGPCLDHVPGWIARQASARRYAAIAAMWKTPLYMGLFSIPILAPLLARLRLVDPVIKLSLKVCERPEPVDTRRPAGPNARKNSASIRIYAANVIPRMLHPQRGGTDVPVQILTPTRDIFIPAITQADPHPGVRRFEIRELPGGHWAPTFNPDAVTVPIRSWVAQHTQSQAGKAAKRKASR